MYIPPKINKGFIIKVREENGSKRYDFQYIDRYGYTNTIGGISRLFNEEFWNYAKLISASCATACRSPTSYRSSNRST